MAPGIGLDYSLQWWLTGVHVSEITAEVRAALVDSTGLARPSKLPDAADAEFGRRKYNQRPAYVRRPSSREMDDWLLMHPQLVAVYSSVLAEDFATANRLQPTTDQDNAYVVTNNWTTDRIAAALLGSIQSRSLTPDAMPEALGLLALDLVVPANLDRIPSIGSSISESATARSFSPSARRSTKRLPHWHSCPVFVPGHAE